MATSLPARPHLEHLRAQAKTLLTDLRAGKAAAIRTFIAHLPAAEDLTPAEVRRAEYRLADAQSAIARKAGFDTWAGLVRHVDQLRALEGRWAFVSLEVDGTTMPTAMLATSLLSIDGDRFRTETPEAVYEGTFSIDVKADPPRIDIEFIEGPEAGNWSYGIYRLNGDQLTLCLGLTGAPRPTAFATAPGAGHALERLRRASAARPANVTGGTRGPAAAASSPEAADASAFATPETPLLRALQGEWHPVALVSDGQPLADGFLAFGSRTMLGNETKVVFGGQTMVHAKVRLDESQTPVAVDYLNIGRGPRVVTLGIIERKGDTVKFCMAPAGAPRPADFTSVKGSGRTLSEWKRKPS